MKNVYSIKDTKGGFFDPQLVDNDALAVRACRGLVNSGKGIIAEYPQDFELWYIGKFNELTGEILPDTHNMVIQLAALKDVSQA